MPHPDDAHALKVQLATALKDAAYFKASYARKLEDEKRLLESASVTVAERDALRAQVEAWKEGVCQDCVEGQEALAAARRECEAMRAALTNLDAHLDFGEPWSKGDLGILDPSGINAAFEQARTALATPGNST